MSTDVNHVKYENEIDESYGTMRHVHSGKNTR